MIKLLAPVPSKDVIVLSLEPADSDNEFYLREANLSAGSQTNKISADKIYGPFARAEAERLLEQRRKTLVLSGYRESASSAISATAGGSGDYVADLHTQDRKRRARAATQLGWRTAQYSNATAVPALMKATSEASTEVSVLVDALARRARAGFSETQREAALAIFNDQASKKLLSRRRSGFEALKALDAKADMQALWESGLARFPADTAEVLRHSNHAELSNLELLKTHFKAMSNTDLGLALDQAYEFDTPLLRALLSEFLLDRPFASGRFRYTKSILKRALLRNDSTMVSKIVFALETRRKQGSKATIKSGLDGQSRYSSIYSETTRAWLLRAAWRHLRRVGRFNSAHFVSLAAAMLENYRIDPQGLLSFEHSFMLYRILCPASVLKSVRRRTQYVGKLPALNVAQVPFSQVWQANPNAWVGLLSRCEFAPLQRAIEKQLQSSSTLLPALNSATLAELFSRDTLQAMAGAECERRFNTGAPDIELCCELLHAHPVAASVAVSLLQRSQLQWNQDPSAVCKLLSITGSDAQTRAAECVIAGLNTAKDRSKVLLSLLDDLSSGDAESQAGRLQVIEHFSSELASLLGDEHLLALLSVPQAQVQIAAVGVLAAHPHALELLGLETLSRLAESNHLAVRRHAMRLLARALEHIAQTPANEQSRSTLAHGLLRIADGRFIDARDAAFALIQRLDFAHFGFDAIVQLCDSNQERVQYFARDWVREHLHALDANALLLRLIEHPHRAMQSFALELVETYLPDGAAELQKVQAFLQACLRRARMRRADKDRILRFLLARGLRERSQADIAVAILDDSLRTATLADKEPLLVALTRLQLRYPGLTSDWLLQDAS